MLTAFRRHGTSLLPFNTRKMTSNVAPTGFQMTPLKGIKVVELAGLAPVPHCGMLLADFGADVTLLDKSGGDLAVRRLDRGKRVIEVDLKTVEGKSTVREMGGAADVLLDPYRPGVLEKLGLDPVDLLQANPGLIVCRLTGYGQSGPLANEAGHDINYVAISGLLPTIAAPGRPPWPPVNLLADFGGGGLTAAIGVLLALQNRTRNGGRGCILDVSMTEGLAYLGTFITMYKDIDILFGGPHASFSSNSPVYRCYETSDGRFMSVGALEPKFTGNLLKTLGLEQFAIADVYERPGEITAEIERVFRCKTRDEWTRIFEGKDACVAPVVEMEEAGTYAHNKERGTFEEDDEGRWIPRRHPRMYTLEEYKRLALKSKM